MDEDALKKIPLIMITLIIAVSVVYAAYLTNAGMRTTIVGGNISTADNRALGALDNFTLSYKTL